MNELNHFNNSFSDSNIISIDSNTSINEPNIEYVKVPESYFNCIKNEVVVNDYDDDDKLSQFSGFSYCKDYEYYDNDVLEHNLDVKTCYDDTGSDIGSDLDSDLDFKFDFDIICNISC